MLMYIIYVLKPWSKWCKLCSCIIFEKTSFLSTYIHAWLDASELLWYPESIMCTFLLTQQPNTTFTWNCKIGSWEGLLREENSYRTVPGKTGQNAVEGTLGRYLALHSSVDPLLWLFLISLKKMAFLSFYLFTDKRFQSTFGTSTLYLGIAKIKL